MKFRNLIIVLLSSLLLLSCGSDSTPDDVISSNPPVSGIERSGITYGPITGFGSVIVNGVHYDTSNASFTVDDITGSESDLKVGQIVTLKSRTDDQGNASATEVSFDDDVQGPIELIDLVTMSLVVLGQTVLVDAGTLFDDEIQPASLEGLMIGDVVEISGLVNADGMLIASRIELKNDETEYEVHGIVSMLDTSAQTFMLRDLLVDYSAAIFEDFGSATLADGDLVEVEGSMFAANDALIATTVELEDQDEQIGAEDDDAEIEGLVTAFTSSENFSVAGVPVSTNSATVFEGGSAADIALNVRLEVEGSFNANGVLVAEDVEFEQEATVEITATLDAVDSNALTLTVFGVTFGVNESTSFEDQSDLEVAMFDLADLSAGEYVEVRGYQSEGGLVATVVKRDDHEDTVEVKGPVDSIATDSLVILGITINTDNFTQYRDIDDSPLTATEFFGIVMLGDTVEAEGTQTSTSSMLAKELELDD